ncbi:hypothetical protein EDB82DRAFT_473477 [Fusarium venenatum]|uniref:uncharacterized protein n=1 Tax=Fusarium venenatum TaxID=56646 RepID=UPI001D93D64B|nr:hypothetical protein EDB82DRAFT_473477 [Fusarium venenatum]
MAKSHSETVRYFSLHCPGNSTFYICEGSDNEFIGCRTHDPCRDGGGQCLNNGLRAANFAVDKYDELRKQSCDDTRGSKVWWTCAGTDPPFMGCCDISPCSDGCPSESLLPAVLSKNKEDRQAFLDPVSFFSSQSASPATGGSSAGLSTGAIVGIAIGFAAVGIMLIAFLTCMIWRCRRKRRRPVEIVRSGELQRASETGRSPMTYDSHYFPSTSTVTPYYLSGLSVDHNKHSPPLPISSQTFKSYNMNYTFDRGYEQSYSPVHIMTLHEMDGVERTPQDRDTNPLEEYHEGQEQSPVLGHIPPRIHNLPETRF